MEIGLTDEVRKMAALRPLPAAVEPELLFCWDLLRIDFGQRKLLVASNVATRLCAITRMSGADWRRIDEVAHQLVADALDVSGLDTARYLELAGDTHLSKTHGGRSLGCAGELRFAIDPAEIDMKEKLQWRMMMFFNSRWITKCAGHNGYIYSAEQFARDLHCLSEAAPSWQPSVPRFRLV